MQRYESTLVFFLDENISQLVLFCVMLVCKCTLYCIVLLPPGVTPIAVNKYIISYHVIYHIMSFSMFRSRLQCDIRNDMKVKLSMCTQWS